MPVQRSRAHFLILRRTPYRETSLVVSGISPEAGRIDVIVKGAKTLGPKKFPVFSLFHELEIEFSPPKNGSNLSTLHSFGFSAQYDAIASNTGGYLAACRLAGILLKNTFYSVPIPETYKAFSVMLKRLAYGLPPEPSVPCAEFVFLCESGYTPLYESDSYAEKFISSLKKYALDYSAEPPDLSDGTWVNLYRRIREMAMEHGVE